MGWLLIALCGRLLWALCNAAEQVVSRAHQKYVIVSSFLLITAMQFLFGAAMLLFVADFSGFEWQFLGWLGLASFLNMAGTIPYFMALQKDEAYDVVPFFSFAPLIIIVLAYVFFGEVMSGAQMLGGLVVIACGCLFSWDFRNGQIKLRAMGLVFLSAFCFACFQICLRYVAATADAWMISGIVSLYSGSFAIVVLAFWHPVRQEIIRVAKVTRAENVKACFVANTLDIAGLIAIIMAYQQAPSTGHVTALLGVQPFFSFFIAVWLGAVASQYFAPVVLDRQSFYKLGLLLGIFGGVYLLAGG